MVKDWKKVDGVFEGGGVKGIAFVGAIAATEDAGYEFENVAGTSAGSIVASVIAAGYSAAEIKTIMDDLDYKAFRDKATARSIARPSCPCALGLQVHASTD